MRVGVVVRRFRWLGGWWVRREGRGGEGRGKWERGGGMDGDGWDLRSGGGVRCVAAD